MPNVLILYASTHGHTRKVASCIAATLERDGVTVAQHDVRAGGPEPAALDFDAVLVELSGSRSGY